MKVPETRPPVGWPWAAALSWLLFLSLYAIHFSYIVRYAVNIPQNDDWTALNWGGLGSGPTVGWFLAQANEHRIVFTRAVTWLNYIAFGWNLRIQQVFNFLLYGGVLWALVLFKRKVAPLFPTAAFVLFLVFLLSALPSDNHLWAIQSAMHFPLLFSVLACLLLLSPRQTFRNLLFGTACAASAAFSMASGVVMALIILFFFVLFKIRRREWPGLLLVGAGFAAFMTFWFSGWTRPASLPSLLMPFRVPFWKFFLNLVALGFGFTTISTFVGLTVLVVVLLPVSLLFFKNGRRLPDDLRPVAAICMMLAVFGSTAMGRAALGTGESKASRYAEAASLLVPISAILWFLVLEGRRRQWRVAASGVWCLAAVGFLDNWNYDTAYRNIYRERIAGVECIRGVLFGLGDGSCPRVYYGDLGKKLDIAARLNVSFYRELMAGDRRHFYSDFTAGRALPTGSIKRVSYENGMLEVHGSSWLDDAVAREAPPITSNLLAPDSLTSPPWVTEFIRPAVVTGIAGPPGHPKAARWQFVEAKESALAIFPPPYVLKDGDTVIVSLWCRAPEIPFAGEIRAIRISGPGYAQQGKPVELSGEWQHLEARLALTGEGGSPGLVLWFPGGAPTVDVAGPEMKVQPGVPAESRGPIHATFYLDGEPVAELPGSASGSSQVNQGSVPLVDEWVLMKGIRVRPGIHRVFAVYTSAQDSVFVTSPFEFSSK